MMPDIIATIMIKDIAVAEGRRELNAESVAKLADSIEKAGLRHPVTVRRRNGAYILVAGRHRIEACKQLGLDHISASIATMTEEESRLWEIAENLHRAELTKLERDENLAEWIRITERVSAQVAAKPQGGRPEGGIRAASRELGIDEDDGRRAVKVASISDEAKEAARDAGIDDNRSALLAVAKESTPEAQVAKVADIKVAKEALKQRKPYVSALEVSSLIENALFEIELQLHGIKDPDEFWAAYRRPNSRKYAAELFQEVGRRLTAILGAYQRSASRGGIYSADGGDDDWISAADKAER
jgi:ParB-like chromosome segregation protein Spo0J